MIKKKDLLIEKLEWDSMFFGFNVALLNKNFLSIEFIEPINSFIENEKITLVQFLSEMNNYESMLLAKSNDFNFSDIRSTYEKNINEFIKLEIPTNYSLNKANQKDIIELKKLSNLVCMNSRYFFDKNFSKIKINEFYENWIEKGVLGLFDDECYCLYFHEFPVGFCTILYESAEKASIGLFSISNKHQNKGLAKILLSYVNNILYKKGIKIISVVTQGRNIAAQRAYQKEGYISKTTEVWYHKWIKK